MQSGGTHRTHKGRAYRIVVRGELSRRYAVAFEGMEMETETGHTVLTAERLDQSHLHGVLRINALGLELLSVQSSTRKSEEQVGSAGGGAAAESAR